MSDMTKFNRFENVCLHAAASITGVSLVDIVGSNKKKEIVLARSLACSILNHYGFGLREISRITNTDAKGVSVYLENHTERMRTSRYKRSFEECVEFIDQYEEFSNEAMSEKLNTLYEKYTILAGRYDHLKQLITNN